MEDNAKLLQFVENIFDEKNDITEDDWKEMKNELEKEKLDTTEDFLSYAFALKILDPNIKINISETNVVEDVKQLVETFPPLPESYENENSLPLPRYDEYENLYLAVAAIKVINPALKPDTNNIWNWAIKSLEKLETTKNMQEVQTLTSLAFYMKIIDPSLDLDGIIGDAGWENIKESFYESKNLNFAGKIKVLNPEINLTLNESDWQSMKKSLSEARADKNYGAINGFSQLAVVMKILSAEKIVITENGLEF